MTRSRSSGRLTAIRVIATIMAVSAVGFGLFTVVFGLISPAQEPHAFHNVVVASLLIVLSAPPAISLARAPERATRPFVMLGAIGIAGLATMAASLTPDPFTLPFIVLVGLLWALMPDRDSLMPSGRPSWLLLLLAVAAAGPLVTYAIAQAGIQRTDHTSDHAAFFHWVETSFYAVAVLLLGLLAAVRPAAYRLAGWCAGIAAAVLGIGALLFNSYASAFEAPWAWAALLGGLLFVAATEWEVRRVGRISRTPTPGG